MSKDKLLIESENHEILKTSYWKLNWQIKPLSQRIQKAPAPLVDYLKIQNKLYNYTEVPSSIAPTKELIDAVQMIESTLPLKIKKLLQQNLIGFFAVKDLGSSGFTEVVFDQHKKIKYAFIALDMNLLLKRKANEWATWRENSFFKPNFSKNAVTLTMKIENENNNNITHAIKYLLLHEIGHVLGITTKQHMSWFSSTPNNNYTFQKLSWKMVNAKMQSKYYDIFPERTYIKAYSFEKSKLTNKQIPVIYNKIKQTNYPTLYAAHSIFEDFAESFSIYIHAVVNKKPWKITIEKPHKSKQIFRLCWDKPRCKSKREFFDKWINN